MKGIVITTENNLTIQEIREPLHRSPGEAAGIPEETILQIAGVLVTGFRLKEGQHCDRIP